MRIAIFILSLLILQLNSNAQVNTYEIIPQSNSSIDSALVMKLTKVTKNCAYLSREEKDVIQWMNIARMYPKWFLYFRKIKNTDPVYTKTLIKTLMTMQPIQQKLIPSKELFFAAKCHAETAGPIAYMGHKRQNAKCKKPFHAECIYYGNGNAARVVEAFLIDKGVPSLGHRLSLLNAKLKVVGLNQGPFGKDQKSSITVVDFKR